MTANSASCWSYYTGVRMYVHIYVSMRECMYERMYVRTCVSMYGAYVPISTDFVTDHKIIESSTKQTRAELIRLL
jgi:hypothetical protein